MSDRLLKLVKGAQATAAKIDAASRAFERELAKVWRDLGRQLPALIADAAQGSPTAIVRAARAQQLRRELRKALEAAGYPSLAESAYGAPVDELTDRVLATRRLASVTANLSKSATTKLEALRTLHLGDLLDEGDVVAKALWQATTRGIFGSQSLDKILGDLGDVLEGREPHIRTLYDTSLSIYGRQVEALQAGDEPETTFAYLGPVDDVTRPFCYQYAGRVMTRAEIDDLDNGQLDNVFLTGGGFNCRHTWVEVSRFSELRDLVGTDDRVPEIQTQIDEIEEAA